MTRALVRWIMRRLPLCGGCYRMINHPRVRRRFAAGGVVETRLPCGALILCDLDDNDGRALYFCGTNDPKVGWVLRRLLRAGDTVFDVGANHGEYTLYAATLVGAGGRVHAFEPNPDLAARIVRSASSNAFAQVHVHPVGLSERAGQATLHVPAGWSGGAMLAEAEVPEHRTIDVALRRGDAEVDLPPDGRVRLLKIDVEGHEAPVLRGLTTLLRAGRVEVVLFESGGRGPFSDHPAVRTLRELGDWAFVEVARTVFRVRLEPREPTWAGTPTGRDFLAVRRECWPEAARALGLTEGPARTARRVGPGGRG